MNGLRALVTHRGTVRGAQIVIGLVMGWAALAKLGDLAAFAQQVHNFRSLPLFAENLVAMMLPWIELIAALSLLLGIRPRSGALVTTTLLSVFTLAVAAALARGLDIQCGCFGTADASRVGLGKILQNLALLLVAVVACVRPAGTGTTTESTTLSSRARAFSPET